MKLEKLFSTMSLNIQEIQATEKYYGQIPYKLIMYEKEGDIKKWDNIPTENKSTLV